MSDEQQQPDMIDVFDQAAFRTAAATLSQSVASQTQQHMNNVVETACLFHTELVGARAKIRELEAELVIERGKVRAAAKGATKSTK